ncbi:MAG TPA: ABC transporter ATP-binding protein [Acidimicrobiales bacterium]|jgi:putative ABC transport system ATP-binding protein
MSRLLRPVRRGADETPAPQPDAARPAERRPGNVIVVNNVFKTYAIGDIEVHALQGVSLTIERGDFVAIMGASGSGKSTLMNILGCLDLPTRGRYLLDGVDVRGMTDDELSDVRNRKIGFVFQSFNLIARTPAIVNVELPLIYGGLRHKGDRRRRALQAMEAVGLGDRIHHLPSELSGGQQQRVAVARAIATNPAMILADEPTGNLDTKATHEVLDIFSGLNAGGRTVVMITHEDDVAAASKRIIRLVDGRIVDDHRLASVDGPPPRYEAHGELNEEALLNKAAR